MFLIRQYTIGALVKLVMEKNKSDEHENNECSLIEWKSEKKRQSV